MNSSEFREEPNIANRTESAIAPASRIVSRPIIESHTGLSVIGIIVTLGFACLPISRWENEFKNVAHLVGYEIIWWVMVASVLAYVRFAERRPLVSIGFRAPSRLEYFLAVFAGTVMVAGVAAIYFLMFPALHFNEEQQVNQLIATPFWWRLISVIRAAVSEEILFRGYALARLGELAGSLSLAAIVTCTVFTIEHVGPWGWGHLFIAGFGGVALTVLYTWRRNLWVNIIAHGIVDGAAVLLA